MDYGAAVLALLVTNEITLLQILYHLQGKDTPSRIPALMGKLGKQKYNQVVLRLKNLGDVKPIPAVRPDVEIRFSAELLKVYERVGVREDVNLTETEWITSGKWKALGGGTPQNFRDQLDKFNTERIVERSNPGVKKSKWILSRGGIGKLKTKVATPPPLS